MKPPHLSVLLVYQVRGGGSGKSAKYSNPLCMALNDYEKAFDSVQISAVLQTFRRLGVDVSVYIRMSNL